MPDSKPAEGRPLVGDVIAGKYRIDSVAGEGGMGIVYEAEHVILRQRVAVKAMLPGALSSAEALERFSTEASAIARIACEHVVRVMDAGTLPSGAPYLVMEYLDGVDLEMLARRGGLPPQQVVDFALQSLEALAHAHAARVIHRDLKPANLFLACMPDGRQIIKLLDFGVAMSVDFDVEEDRVVGSPRYMSPEQLRKGVLDARTDLWSLGVVLYELLSGEPPFDGSLSELVTAVLQKDPVPLHEKNRAISPELSRVVGRCLVRDPAARWGSAAELARALAPYGSGAWEGALERIVRALSKTTPNRGPRRFETLETALQALDSTPLRDDNLATQPPPEPLTVDSVVSSRAPLSSPEAFRATMPAPPSAEPMVNILYDKPPNIVLPSGATTLASAQAPAAPVDPSVPEKRALRILMIDDSEFVLGVHSHVLKKAGFEVRATMSPREFDDLLAGWKPHLVLMDVQMPNISGDELCRRVKARFKATVPVVFVSDLPRPQLAERAKIGGADAFLSKSSDWAGFVDFVRNICAITYSPEDLP